MNHDSITVEVDGVAIEIEVRDGKFVKPEILKRVAGTGTALKPAAEIIVMARKPLTGTVSQNVLLHGCGGLNIDGCRIEGAPRNPGFVRPNSSGIWGGSDNNALVGYESPQGRWPANLIIGDDETAALLDEQSGERPSGGGNKRGKGGMFEGRWKPVDWLDEPSTGGASRYFLRVAPDAEADEPLRFAYVPKASKRDRSSDGAVNNIHPTCKPTSLMSWLCKLITPPNGVVLDCFLGSGSTGVSAVLEGFSFIGIDNEAEYLAIADKRIAWAMAHAASQAEPQLPLFEVA